jgi:hypothetical protein
MIATLCEDCMTTNQLDTRTCSLMIDNCICLASTTELLHAIDGRFK